MLLLARDRHGTQARLVTLVQSLSLRARLVLLVLAAMVPLLGLGLVREYEQYRAAIDSTGRQTLALARSMSLVVGEELEARIAVLQALAQSRRLKEGDLPGFRLRAEGIIAGQFPGANILLLRSDGQQLVNTLLPAGATLPVRTNLDSLRLVFATKRPAVSNLYHGAIRPRVVAIDVPVIGKDGSVAYVLSMNPGLDAFAEILRQQGFPDSWTVSLLDRRGVNVAHMPSPEEFVGQPAGPLLQSRYATERQGIIEGNSLVGVPLVAAFAHEEVFGWTIGIGVPRAELTRPALQAAVRSFAVGGIVILIGLSLALYVARQITAPINALRGLAGAGDKDALRDPPATGLRETDEVVAALQTAEQQRQRSETDEQRARAALHESEAKLSQAQKMEAIGQLTGGLAHDFNNLLGIVIGNLDVARPGLSKLRDADGLVGEALDAALRGAELTRRLLAFARRQPLQPERIAVNEIVAEMTKLLRRTLGEQIEVSLDLAEDLWPVVADAAQLEASLTNLATNARDAMPRGGRLMFTTRNCHLDADYAGSHPDVVPGDFITIEVNDDGTGMKPEILNRIFEPFFTTKDRGKGTGLGLAMVFGFMKQSGGHINVYSEEGAGTTFRLYLPRADAGALAETRTPAAALSLCCGETILIVEDNAAMRRVVLRQITEFGYRVLEAENAAAALALLATERVDMLFTDVVMPGGMNGIELARAAIALVPSLKIVITSGFPEMKLHGHGTPVTFTRLLSKPYRKEDLARALREAFAA